MPFSSWEREALLAVKGLGPAVVQRLEQMGFDTLEQLAEADAREIVTTASELTGSTCWKNSPQARAAIDGAIGMAGRFVQGRGAAVCVAASPPRRHGNARRSVR